MPMEKFRIKSRTIALFSEDGRQVAHTIPKGATVFVEGENFIGKRFVEVVWNETKVVMFAQDIQSRGERVD